LERDGQKARFLLASKLSEKRCVVSAAGIGATRRNKWMGLLTNALEKIE
jgi:hypothetical protein